MATDGENITTNTSLEENPAKPLEVTDPVPANPDRIEDSALTIPSDVNSGSDEAKDVDDSKSGKGTAASSISVNSAPVTDTEKKIRRAERFGITVQLSEKEKRDSRAERFGTGSTLKNSEEQKRKARAERFGIPVTMNTDEDAKKTANADEDAKKKARLERFAPTSKTDAHEEDKRKAREIRFSQSSSNSLSMNGKESTESNAAIAGKAGGGS